MKVTDEGDLSVAKSKHIHMSLLFYERSQLTNFSLKHLKIYRPPSVGTFVTQFCSKQNIPSDFIVNLFTSEAIDFYRLATHRLLKLSNTAVSFYLFYLLLLP
jgi:hypothetical protein